MRKISKDRLRYLVPSAITLAIYSVILAVKGIYPFGNNTIDYYDMAQQMAPFYYHVYDALHGTKNIFFDWYTALGINMSNASNSSCLSLFNLFFLFVRRDALLESLSVFTGIKLMCMSLGMYFYLDGIHHETPSFFKTGLAVGYSFCGFVLMNYTINPWLDVAALFPVLMYFYNRLISMGVMKGYVITLALTLITSYYLSFIILMFLFLYTGILLLREQWSMHKFNMRLVINEGTAGLAVIRLGISTLLGLGSSSFILIPQLMQMMGSSRFQNGEESDSGLLNSYLSVLSHVKGDYTTRWWVLLGLSFAAAIIFTGIIKCRKNRELIVTAVSMIMLMTLELFFENVNLLLHFGSYVHYPIRNGFIICFVFADLACLFAGELFKKDEGGGYLSLLFTLAGSVLFIVLYNRHPGMPLRTVFHITAVMIAVTFLIYFLLLNPELFAGLIDRFCKKKNGSVRPRTSVYRWSMGLFAFEIICYGFLMFGQPDYITGYTEDPEQSGAYIYICDQLREAFDLQPERLARVKNPDESLNANYGFVLMHPALSSWTAMLTLDEQAGASRWGYSYQYTRLLDAGGTVFSDALLNIRSLISCVPVDDRLYKPVASAKVIIDRLTGACRTYTMYEPKFTLPFGVIVDDSVTEEIYKAGDIVALHNAVYMAMLKGADVNADQTALAGWIVINDKEAGPETAGTDAGCYDPANAASVSVTEDGTQKEVQIDLNVDKETVLYLLGSGGDNDFMNTTVSVVRGSSAPSYIGVPTIGDPDNILYPAYFNNHALCLGTYCNETLHIEVRTDLTAGDPFPVSIMGIDTERLSLLCKECAGMRDNGVSAGKNSIMLSVDNTGKGRALLLPVTYDRGWRTYVNGDEVSVMPCAGLFMKIPLEEGINDITMSFMPFGMKAGILVTCLTALVIALYLLSMRRRRKDLNTEQNNGIAGRKVEGLFLNLYIICFFAATAILYIIPVVYGIIIYIGKIL